MSKTTVKVNGVETPFRFAPVTYREPRYKWLPRFLQRWYKGYWLEFTEEELVANRDFERLAELRNRRRRSGVIVLDKAPQAGEQILVMYTPLDEIADDAQKIFKSE